MAKMYGYVIDGVATFAGEGKLYLDVLEDEKDFSLVHLSISKPGDIGALLITVERADLLAALRAKSE